MWKNLLRHGLFLWIGLPLFVHAESNQRIWNLQNADIKTVVEQVSKETGRNFILDNRVKGNVTIISQQPIGREEVYEVFLSVLEVMGFTAIEGKGATTIVPDASARHMGLPVKGSPTEGYPDMMVQVIPIKHVSAQALVPVLRPLISPQGGHLSGYAPSNMLIVADRKETVNRLNEIVSRVDVDDSNDIEVVQIKHAIPSEVVNVLSSVLNHRRPGEIPTAQVTLSADDRSNLIILSGDKSKRLKIRALIASMDIKAPGTGNTEVIYVKYQKAEDLVKVIINVIQSYFSANRSNTQNASGNNSAVLDALKTSGNASVQSNTSTTSGSSADVGSGLTSDTRQAVGTVIGGFGVQAEPNLNALVVTAPMGLMRNIKQIIAKLDQRRAQVLVEAIVVELEDVTSNTFGVEWRVPGKAAVGGMTFGSETGSLTALKTLASSGDPYAFATGLSLGIIRDGSIRALLSALESDTTNNILATPSVVALDNSKAKIFVGEKVPFKEGTSLANGVTTENIKREDVGLGLAIVPQITKDDAIVLALEQKADTVVKANDNSDLLTQKTTNRLINTKVIVNDGDILVLGGLIRSQEERREIKMPILGNLPLIGRLFRSESKGMTKRNLVVFLRPTIMRDKEDSLNVTGSKYQFIQDRLMLEAYNERHAFKPYPQKTTFPAWNQSALAEIPEPF